MPLVLPCSCLLQGCAGESKTHKLCRITADRQILVISSWPLPPAIPCNHLFAPKMLAAIELKVAKHGYPVRHLSGYIPEEGRTWLMQT